MAEVQEKIGKEENRNYLFRLQLWIQFSMKFRLQSRLRLLLRPQIVNSVPEFNGVKC
jgi:hypothetical protein